MADTAESTTVVSLPQMVDLALNSPEVGIVNFTVLHSLLHVIVNQLELTDTNVEFRGSDSERLQGYISHAKPGPLLTLTEYTIEDQGPQKKKKKTGKRGSIEKGKKDEEQKERRTSKSKSVDSTQSGTVVLVESGKGLVGPQFTVAVTKNNFEKLEADLQKLKKKVQELAELPGNTALIQALRADSVDSTPVLDMFHILSLSKRLDAAEVAMEKVASLVEEKGKQGLLSIEEEQPESVASSEHPPWSEVIERIEALELKMQGVRTSEEGEYASGAEGATGATGATGAAGAAGAEGPSGSEGHKGHRGSRVGRGSHSEGVPPQVIQNLHAELAEVKKAVETFSGALVDLEEIKKMLRPVEGATSENVPPDVRLNQIEVRFRDLVEQVNSLDNMFSRQTHTLQDRIGDVEKEFNEIIEKIKLGLPAGDATAGMEGQSMSDMYTILMQLQDDVTTMSETAQKLMEERDERQHALDVMLEQVELLKTVKADREDLEDALAEKADACQINKKVSLEQFDAVCVDMSKSIEEALHKLTDQETLWTQALDEIQKDVGNKLDKMELTPLRDFINKKLKHLQEKVKTLSAMKKENEAAGTKTRFLKNVNCISCDKDVIMRKEVDSSLFPKPYALPPTRNMGPYLAYELDQLRKQQKCLPQSKNLNTFENAMQSARSAKSPDHICNRYCGGSHTVTTPQQRVTRIGHFLEQWGPEIGPLNETNIRGTDGQMYKGRDDKALRQLAAEKAGHGAVDHSAPSTPTTPGGKSGTQMQTQSSGPGIAGRPGTEVTGTGTKKSGAESAHEGDAPAPSEAHPAPDAGQAGGSTSKKTGSRSSVRGSKSSIKSPNKQSAEKISVPEELEAHVEE